MCTPRYIILIVLLFFSNLGFSQKKVPHNTPKDKNKEVVQTNPTVDKEIVLITDLDRVSYSLGVNIGTNIKSQGLRELNMDAFVRAIQDVFADKEPQITNEAAGKAIQEYFINLQQAKIQGKKQKALDYLAENAKKKDVSVLPSGLQYTVLKAGSGAKPQPADHLLVSYHCTSIDGTVVATTFKDNVNSPIMTNLDQTIKGISEALQNMTAGSKWKVLIPYDLGYGETGNNGKPGPYENLQMIIELIAIQ